MVLDNLVRWSNLALECDSINSDCSICPITRLKLYTTCQVKDYVAELNQRNILKPLDVRSRHNQYLYDIFDLIKQYPGINGKELEEKLNHPNYSVNNYTNRLRKLGYVEYKYASIHSVTYKKWYTTEYYQKEVIHMAKGKPKTKSSGKPK